MMSSHCRTKRWIAALNLVALSALVLFPVPIHAAVPFPAALESAAIVQDRCDDLLDRSCLIGNGDINALVYADGGSLILRLSKNDVWDARFDTSSDPPLLPIKKIRELARGDWLKAGAYGGGYLNPDGTPYQGPNSWDKPYPCPLSCGVIRLGDRPSSRRQWRLHRDEGEQSAFVREGTGAVMTLAGRKGTSNGFACGPLDYSTDDYARLRVRVSGTANARFYVDVLGPANSVLFGSGWIETPQSAEERVFELPPKKSIATVILYTWTKDGRTGAEPLSFPPPGRGKGQSPPRVSDLSWTTENAKRAWTCAAPR